MKKQGIIDTIAATLVATKSPVSVDDLTKVLRAKFPKRKAAALKSTVRHQVYELPRSRGLRIKRIREGRTVLYTATAPKKKAA